MSFMTMTFKEFKEKWLEQWYRGETHVPLTDAFFEYLRQEQEKKNNNATKTRSYSIKNTIRSSN
jgi:hypothetical protein